MMYRTNALAALMAALSVVACSSTPMNHEAILNHDATVWIPGMAPVAKKKGDVVPVDEDGIFVQAPGKANVLVIALSSGPATSTIDVTGKAPAPTKNDVIAHAPPAPKLAPVTVKEAKEAKAAAPKAERAPASVAPVACAPVTCAPVAPAPVAVVPVALPKNSNEMMSSVLGEVNEIQSLMRFKRNTEALKRTDTLLQRYPDLTYLNLLKASVLTLLGRRDEARQALDLVLKDFPADVPARGLYTKLSNQEE